MLGYWNNLIPFSYKYAFLTAVIINNVLLGLAKLKKKNCAV